MNHSTRTAKYSIAEDYLYGQNGKEQNLDVAYEYITGLLKEGISSSACKLMGDYYEFIGLSDESFFYHHKAAELGDGPSQLKMAEKLCSRIHTDKRYKDEDILKGIAFYTMALNNSSFEKSPEIIEDIELSINYYSGIRLEDI